MSNVNDLLEKKRKLEESKWFYYNKFNEMNELIKETNKLIFKECNHDWERDYSAYDRPEKICKICSLINNSYIYS